MTVEEDMQSAGSEFGSIKQRSANSETLNAWVRIECKRADKPELATLFDSFKQLPDYKQKLQDYIAWEMKKYE